MKDEALKLADELNDYIKELWMIDREDVKECQDMIRKLVAELDKCSYCKDTGWVCENHPTEEAHKCSKCGGAGMPCVCNQDAPQTKPLSDEFIMQHHMGYISPNGDFYAPDYITWKEDGFTPVFKEPVAPQTKPLSDEEIIETWFELPESASISQRQVAFARAIEERLGVK